MGQRAPAASLPREAGGRGGESRLVWPLALAGTGQAEGVQERGFPPGGSSQPGGQCVTAERGSVPWIPRTPGSDARIRSAVWFSSSHGKGSAVERAGHGGSVLYFRVVWAAGQHRCERAGAHPGSCHTTCGCVAPGVSYASEPQSVSGSDDRPSPGQL